MLLRLDFDRHLKLKFQRSAITTAAGLLGFRELDDAFGLTDMVCNERPIFADHRCDLSNQLRLPEAGYSTTDENDDVSSA
jgi:hypothetical protein